MSLSLLSEHWGGGPLCPLLDPPLDAPLEPPDELAEDPPELFPPEELPDDAPELFPPDELAEEPPEEEVGQLFLKPHWLKTLSRTIMLAAHAG